MEFDLENPLTSFSEHEIDTTVETLFASEADQMSSHNFLQDCFLISFRRRAISLLFQAQYSCNLDEFISYLAVTYMDRFLSTQEIPQEQPWILRLVVISCLSLASKMKNAVFSLSDFQREEGIIFDGQTIRRMELLILNALKWRMRSVTPFSFVHFFLSLFHLKDPPLTRALKDRATDIIFKAHHEIEILEFKPSIIAASALLSASDELFPLQFHSFRSAISSCEYVNKEKLLRCYSLMQEKVMVFMDGDESIIMLMEEERESTTNTPICVLDINRHNHHHHNNNNNNSETETIVTTTTTTTTVMTASAAAPPPPAASERGGDVKRRRLNDFCTFQLSQTIHQPQVAADW